MSPIIFFVVLFFIALDLTFLRKQDPRMFVRGFQVSRGGLIVLALFFICVVLYLKETEEFLTGLLFLLLPVYFYKRVRFKRQLPAERKLPESLGLGLSLLLDSFGVLLCWFGGMLIISVIIKVATKVKPVFSSELDEVVALAAISSFFLIGLIIRALKKYSTLSIPAVFGLVKNKQSWGKLIVLPLILGGLLAGAASFIILNRSAQPTTPLSEIISSSTSFSGIMAFVVMAVLLAPFLEEIIFRGFFFYVIAQFKGMLWAVVIIAGVFALMHFDQYWGDWIAIIVVTLLGLLLTFLRAWTGSSIPGIVMHYIFNGAMTVIPVLSLVMSNPSYYEYQLKYQELNLPAKEELLTKSIAAQPKFAPAYNDLAWAYAEAGENLPQALQFIEQALALEPKSAAFLDTKAEVLFKMGQVAEAVQIEQDLLQKNPGDSYARKQLEKFSAALAADGQKLK